jgi:hypothetical protein
VATEQQLEALAESLVVFDQDEAHGAFKLPQRAAGYKVDGSLPDSHV